MSKYISLTAIGKDKFGIVSTITEVLYREKCNIEDSTMTILHGQFAMILIIRLHSDISKNMLLSKLKKYSKSLNLSLFCTDINSYTPKKHLSKNTFVISIYGPDKTGIVYNISKYLADNKINITDVQTILSKHDVQNTYMMVVESNFPINVSEKEISKDLFKLAKSLNINISINQAESSNI
jgi:glycine cleavage system transcriptional repressor